MKNSATRIRTSHVGALPPPRDWADVYMPAHHDAAFHGLWRAIEPVFQALKDEQPDLVTVSKTYRQPTCFNTEFNVSRPR